MQIILANTRPKIAIELTFAKQTKFGLKNFALKNKNTLEQSSPCNGSKGSTINTPKKYAVGLLPQHPFISKAEIGLVAYNNVVEQVEVNQGGGCF